MSKFVDTIAKVVLENEIPTKDWQIIIPSERAKQYIQKAFYEQKKSPLLAPKLVTINSWVNSLSEFTMVEKTRLLIKLYEIHLEYPATDIDKSFDEFLNWGQILLADFDEIERYQVDSKLLFRNLKDIKEIENWSFNSEELSENQKTYLAFWERLPHYFEELKKRLLAQNACLQGAIYKNVSIDINTCFDKNKNAHFLFAGFNALSLSEMLIFKQLSQLGRAKVIFDTDDYYLKDQNHEAGQFIRKYYDFSLEKNNDFAKNDLLTKEKNINLISCSQITGQVKVASTLLAKMTSQDVNETLILLADESLIIPLLQNIPRNVEKANITLGLPLKASALLTWIDLIFRVQESFLRYQRNSVYFKDLFSFWNHPFISEITNDKEKQSLFKRENSIRRKNVIFQDAKKINVSEKIDEILNFIYTPWENDWKRAISLIRSLNLSLYNELVKKDENRLERAVVQKFDEVIVDFQNCANEGFPEMSLRSFKNLFYQQWTKESIAYYGNPMDGLQIMGLLETRLLDFKKIIVLGLNEGKMPPSNQIQTMIPMDLRSYFNLPSIRDKQGLFAHHFYRLLHECEEMTITYHNGSEGIGFSEKSRYITQLELELARENTKFKINYFDYTLEIESNQKELKSIEKTEDIILKLDALFASRTSASMIKSYFTCPLDFYYKYVLKFGEEDKVEEELESNTFGTLIHSVLEDLYAEFNSEIAGGKKKNLMKKDIEKMLSIFKPMLFSAFKSHFNGDEDAFLKGKNFLSYSMAIELTEQFLKSEKAFFESKPNSLVYILGLEKSLGANLEVPVFGEIKKVYVKGYIDRVDEIDGKIRIIDYKSGRVNRKEVDDEKSQFKGTELEYLIKTCKETKHFFQLLTYVFLYFQNQHEIVDQSAIISFVNFRDNPFIMRARDLSYGKLIEFYPQLLSSILEEIYDETIPFEHKVKHPSYCVYC